VAFDGRLPWPSGARSMLAEVHGALDRMQAGLIAFINSFAGDRLATVTTLHHAAAAALHRRQTGMQVQGRSAARELVQSGLFDRRAMRAAAATEHAHVVQMEDLIVRAGRPQELDGPLRSHFEIAAVLAGSPG
jgi:hypothetical protein